MVGEKQNNSFLMQLIIAVFLAALIGVNGWALAEIMNQGKQVVRNTSRLDDIYEAGPQYTRSDAEKDFGVVMALLESQGKTIDTNAGRIRDLERSFDRQFGTPSTQKETTGDSY